MGSAPSALPITSPKLTRSRTQRAHLNFLDAMNLESPGVQAEFTGFMRDSLQITLHVSKRYLLRTDLNSGKFSRLGSAHSTPITLISGLRRLFMESETGGLTHTELTLFNTYQKVYRSRSMNSDSDSE